MGTDNTRDALRRGIEVLRNTKAPDRRLVVTAEQAKRFREAGIPESAMIVLDVK